jgi:thymidylate synthase (FAD)
VQFTSIILKEIVVEKIDLLDHGLVRLVDSMGNDLSVVRSARVSYDAPWRAGEDEKGDTRLLNYLWRNHHTTPFETVTLTFEVKAPIFVFRQWHRHRTQSYNELSARYKELPVVYYTPEVDQITQQSTDNKQMRTTIQNPHAKAIQKVMDESCTRSFEEYQWMLDKGCPRELARGVLPFFTYSHMFATANLLNWLKFFTLRSHNHAQHEIRVYSDAMVELARTVAPVCVAAWEKTHER